MSLSVGVCAASQGEALLVGLFLLVSLAFMFLAFTFNAKGFYLFSGLLGLMLSWYIVGCIPIVGFLYALFSLFVMTVGAVEFRATPN